MCATTRCGDRAAEITILSFMQHQETFIRHTRAYFGVKVMCETQTQINTKRNTSVSLSEDISD